VVLGTLSLKLPSSNADKAGGIHVAAPVAPKKRAPRLERKR